MKTKRCQAVLVVTLANMLLMPAVAYAVAEEMPLRELSHHPIFISVVLVACLALGSSIILACINVHLFYSTCKNTECSYHPKSSRLENCRDFSQIETAEKPLSTSTSQPIEDEAIAAFGASVIEKVEIAQTKPSSPVQTFEQRQYLRRTLAAEIIEELGNEGFPVEEPNEKPPMDFTDDMIQQVIAVLRQQQEQYRLLQQATLQQVPMQEVQQPQEVQESQEVQEPQEVQEQPQEVQEQPQEVQEQPLAPLLVTLPEKERSGQRAAIEWLVIEQRPDGRHFKPTDHTRNLADSPVSGRHARLDQEEQFQRVG